MKELFKYIRENYTHCRYSEREVVQSDIEKQPVRPDFQILVARWTDMDACSRWYGVLSFLKKKKKKKKRVELKTTMHDPRIESMVRFAIRIRKCIFCLI